MVMTLLLALPAFATDLPPEFDPLLNFPAAPAEFSFFVSPDTLRDGRFVLYDGNDVLVQSGQGVDGFSTIATGYSGDPAFIAVAPDGYRCLLGAGFGASIYLVDAEAPTDNGAAIASIDGHFAAEFINDDLVLIDRGVIVSFDPFTVEADLGILDLSIDPPTFTVVVPGGRGASAALTMNNGIVYATDGLDGELRSFSANALIDAHTNSTTVAWEDGQLIGNYNTGGVMAVSNLGSLIIGGFDPDIFTGSIQFVDPLTGDLAATIDPSGNVYSIYNAVYDSGTGSILAVATDFPGPVIGGFISRYPYEDDGAGSASADPTNQGPTSVPPGMPLGGATGLFLLVLTITLGGSLIIRRQNKCLAIDSHDREPK
jgi:hypothetical protein